MYLDPTIYNVALTTQNVEYSQAIPEDAKKILIRSRNASDIKLSYVQGESGTKFVTIPAGSGGKTIENGHWKGTILYMQSPDGSDVAEIEIWK